MRSRALQLFLQGWRATLVVEPTRQQRRRRRRTQRSQHPHPPLPVLLPRARKHATSCSVYIQLTIPTRPTLHLLDLTSSQILTAHVCNPLPPTNLPLYAILNRTAQWYSSCHMVLSAVQDCGYVIFFLFIHFNICSYVFFKNGKHRAVGIESTQRKKHEKQ